MKHLLAYRPAVGIPLWVGGTFSLGAIMGTDTHGLVLMLPFLTVLAWAQHDPWGDR